MITNCPIISVAFLTHHRLAWGQLARTVGMRTVG